MYRQIIISEDDRKYHGILWRSDPSQNIRCYELQTITYGTASASFLATRCLQQLSLDFESIHPKACGIIRRDFYVDDLLTGADSAQVLEELLCQIVNILKSAGFHLRKWLINSSINLKDTDHSQICQIGNNDESRTLGVSWQPQLHEFIYQISQLNISRKVIKREIFSVTARIFDPLGLLGPMIVIAKLIIQTLRYLGMNQCHMTYIISGLNFWMRYLPLKYPYHVMPFNRITVLLNVMVLRTPPKGPMARASMYDARTRQDVVRSIYYVQNRTWPHCGKLRCLGWNSVPQYC